MRALFRTDPFGARFAVLRAAVASAAIALLVADHYLHMDHWVIICSALVLLVLICGGLVIAIGSARRNVRSEALNRIKEEENLHLADIVRSSKDAIFSVDLDGKVTAVVGTHTHVQTADERILPKGTAYLTDVGMTGPHDSIIGVEVEPALGRFLNGMPARFETATANPRLNGVIIEADETTGLATDIERISYSLDELEDLARDADA